MWVARDKDGCLKLWSSKPNRVAPPTNIPTEPIPTIWSNGGFSIPLSKNTWKELTWDDEPIEVELTKVDRHYTEIECKKCNKKISYLSSDIETTFICTQPSSGYEDEFEFITCPYCGERIYL